MKRALDVETLADDGDQHIGGHGNPDLSLDGILRCPEEALDAQMLFDPFEEQLDLPAALEERTDTQGRDAEVIGEKDVGLFALQIVVANAPQSFRIVCVRTLECQFDSLIA